MGKRGPYEVVLSFISHTARLTCQENCPVHLSKTSVR